MASKFVIIGASDNPVYEVDFVPQTRETPHFGQFIVHSSLDLIEETKWKTKDMFLKKVDTFGPYNIMAWVTASNAKFVLLTEKAETEQCKLFFAEVYELYLKTLLNPFYAPSSPITSPLFDGKIKKLGQRYL